MGKLSRSLPLSTNGSLCSPIFFSDISPTMEPVHRLETTMELCAWHDFTKEVKTSPHTFFVETIIENWKIHISPAPFCVHMMNHVRANYSGIITLEKPRTANNSDISCHNI